MTDIDSEKRKLVWESLQFLASQRNKALMRLNLIRKNKRYIAKEEERELREARRLKSRILDEIDTNMKLFTNIDKTKFRLNDKPNE